MYLDELISQVQQHVESLGFNYELTVNPRCTQKAIDDAERKISIGLPDELRQILLEYGDGFVFRWPAGEDVWWNAEERGALVFPGLDELLEFRVNWESFLPYLLETEDELTSVEDPAIAIRNAKDIQQWVPIFEEGNGDQFVLHSTTGVVLYHMHDWLDGGSGENGLFVAKSLREFLSSWTHVCFTWPWSQYWPRVLTGDGVEWSSDEFNKKFVIGA